MNKRITKIGIANGLRCLAAPAIAYYKRYDLNGYAMSYRFDTTNIRNFND